VRRSDREITDPEEITQILKSGTICRLALSVENVPYIVPMNYGVEFLTPLILYFHCAPGGRKLDMLAHNNRVCFEIEAETEIKSGNLACDWTMLYKSVIGYGTVEVIKYNHQKIHGLNILMSHYAGKAEFFYNQKLIDRMLILKLVVDSISGKRHSL
jgi:nitroimidazol reductase NimA-like FMN-containing flavoprotein (pyridoxamine 5'-phosphate oxidase superfamily)